MARKRKLDLSPEVIWYLTEHTDYGLPTCLPLHHTPEPRDFPGAFFDPAAVDQKIKALRHLRHTKGKWAGRPIEPTAEQVAYIIAPIFGWKYLNDDGKAVRIIRDAYVEMPRKGAKTTLAASLAELLAFADDEPGAEVLIGAASRDQARNAFGPLKAVTEQSETLKAAGVRALRSEIVQPLTSSSIKIVSSRGDLSHGANVHGGLVDELHVHRNGDLLEAIESGTGAREQPLTIIITTADEGKTTTVYAQRRDMIEKLASKVFKNPFQYGVVFAADDDDDPFSELTWEKANPLYPETPSKQFMVAAAKKAQTGGPAALASFLRLHLGIRSSLGGIYFAMNKWDVSAGPHDGQSLDPFAARLAFGGLDLASVSDVTALVWLIRDPDLDGFDVVARCFVPEEAMMKLDATTSRTASKVWVPQGWLSVTPGDVTDYDFIKEQAKKDADILDVEGLGFDRWNSSQLVIDLASEGLPMERIGQGYGSMSAPLKEIDRLVRKGSKKEPLFRHGGNPVLKWMAYNLRPAMDAAGNVKPDKARSVNKIDGISAATIAMAVALTSDVVRSAYESGSGVESV